MNNLRLSILTLLIVLISSLTNAQPYQSIFGQNSTNWVFKYNWQGQYNFIDSVYVEKDTSVYGTQYKKIVSPPGMQRPWLVREDLNTGSVWARYTNPYTVLGWEDTVEKLLFRMDLNVGDTFDIYWLSPPYASQYPDSLKTVDSVKVINGRKHIYFKGKAPQNEPFTLIEGISSNMGLIWKYQGGFMGGQYLLCSYKDGQKTDYQNLFYNGDCYPPLSVQTISEANIISVYPNPVVGTLKIDMDEPVNEVRVYDLIGKAVLITNASIVDFSGLPLGMYIMKVNESMLVKVRKQ